jgi:hypothetical protein
MKKVSKSKMKIPFKSKLKGIRSIVKRNAVFKAMGDQNKRKEIAYDALMLIVDDKIEYTSSGYWDGGLSNIAHWAYNARDLQKKLLKLEETCDVCQRGLFMLSTIRCGNTVDGSESSLEKGSPETIQGFTMDEFKKAEQVYEGWTDTSRRHPYTSGTNERKANICCNVIKNGKFLSSDITDYLKKWNIKIPSA